MQARTVVGIMLGASVGALGACSGDSGASQFDAATQPPQTFASDDGSSPLPATEGGGAQGDGGLSLFYANDDRTLYQLDPSVPTAASMKTIGRFDCVPSQTSVMTDIAVSKDGKLFGVSATAAWPLTIQTVMVSVPNDAGASDAAADASGSDAAADASASDAGFTTETETIVHCEKKWPLPYGTHFNGLTFAPENTVAAQEVLIGGNALGNLYAIDETSGNPTQVGSLGTNTANGLPWGVSGDIVFMANGGNPIGFATARTCTSNTSCDPVDTLLEIDVKALKVGNTGSVLKAVRGPIKRDGSCSDSSHAYFGAIFGIVALGPKVYGFSRWGDFITVDNDTGSGCYDWSASGVNFAGAGITTTAPVIAPPPPH